MNNIHLMYELRHWRICEGFGVGHYTTMGMHFERVQNHHPINRSFQTLPCSTGIEPPCYLCGFAFVGCLSSLSVLRQYALLHLLHQPPQQQQQQPDFLFISSFQRLWVASVVFSPTRHILQYSLIVRQPTNCSPQWNTELSTMITLCITRSGSYRKQFPGFLNFYCISSSTFLLSVVPMQYHLLSCYSPLIWCQPSGTARSFTSIK